jgi:hypothetical protein
VIPVIDGGGDEGSSFRVGSCNSQKVDTLCTRLANVFISLSFSSSLTHDIGLGTDGNQTVDVLVDRDKHLAGHVAALFGTGGLVFNMNSSGAALNKKFCELHDSSQTSVAGVGIGNNGAEVVVVLDLIALLFRGRDALFPLFPVVEQLSEEELVDLVRDSVLYTN